MGNPLPILACLICICLESLSLLSAATAGEARFRQQWYDQGAEITRYELSQSRYGQQRQGDAVLIYVTEPFDVEQQVKSDDPRAATAVPALKLNHTRQFLTGIYPYSVMRSTFQAIDLEAHPHAFKSTTSVQEWCGHVFEQINRRDDAWQFELRSYFQSEGDQNRPLAHSGQAWLADELWTRIRLDPDAMPVGDFELIMGAVTRRFSHLPAQVVPARGRWLDPSPEGWKRYQVQADAWKYRLILSISPAFPWHLQAWEEHFEEATTTARHTHRRYSPYWSENRDNDRPLRKDLGLRTEP